LTLEPISGDHENRHVPFRLPAGARSVDGKFLLRRYGPDPLPLLIRADIADHDAINAWACALVGFADVTCFELPASARPGPAQEPTAHALGCLSTALPAGRTLRSWPWMEIEPGRSVERSRLSWLVNRLPTRFVLGLAYERRAGFRDLARDVAQKRRERQRARAPTAPARGLGGQPRCS
jgi:hypothetical protein